MRPTIDIVARPKKIRFVSSEHPGDFFLFWPAAAKIVNFCKLVNNVTE